MDKIIRSYGTTQYRANDNESRTVVGCAVKFDSDSQDMGFIEQIKRGAITDEVINSSDIFARLDHRDDVVLARSRYGEGSLKLELREDGLYYEFEAPKTQFGDELLEHIKRCEITTSSFAFTISQDENSEVWYNEGGTIRRDILKIDRLYDVSPVYEPAYLSTECDKRKLDEFKSTFTHKYDEMLKEIDIYKI